ncbi:MAG: penicillin-binding protein 1A [Desulfobacterales bacterium]|nr:penicillin-binding protein 1A [Desulfobacterales bacterium]
MEQPTNKSQILKKREKKESHAVSYLIKFIMVLFFLGVVACCGVCAFIYVYIYQELPKITSLRDYSPPIITSLFSDDGTKIAEFFKERRIVIPLSDMPSMLTYSFISAEDSRFFKHQGIDLVSILRAVFKNMEAGTIVQGGSTITQQVAKSFFLTPERSFTRKIKEAILAYRIDQSFSKEDILFLYLNQIYLGHGSYGVAAAADNYFGKTVKELTLAECALLAGLPQAPSRYSPYQYPDRARQRQIYVLNRMVEEKYITEAQRKEALDFKLDIKPRKNWYTEEVSYYIEHVRRYVEERYGADKLYNEGLSIYTSVNLNMQKAACNSITQGLNELDKRQGYRGPLKHLAKGDIEAYVKDIQQKTEEQPIEVGNIYKGVVINVDDGQKKVTVRIGNRQGEISIDDLRWARKPNPDLSYYEAPVRNPSQVLKTGDVILVRLKALREGNELWQLALEQEPETQAALLCLDVETGYVKAMMGGRDFSNSQFNRAIQSKRQPGSAFKPIVYAAAIDKGYTPASIIIDSPIAFQNQGSDTVWKPKNYVEKFYGPTLLREALAKSRNIITIKILQDIGVNYVIEYARRLGITSNLGQNLSLALGSSEVTLLEIVRAYSVFPNLGYLLDPIFITKIMDRNNVLLEETKSSKQKVIDMSTAYIMTSLLQSVITDGTGWRAKVLKVPVAGKTGTTNDLNDAWFVGYTPRYVAGVWLGYDTKKSLGKGETGSTAACPIWVHFMQRILENKPVIDFQVPDDVIFSQVDADTGLLPIPESKKIIFECFKVNSVPKEYTRKPDTVIETDQFFKDDM